MKLISFFRTQKGGSLRWIFNVDPYVALSLDKSQINLVTLLKEVRINVEE